VSGELKTQINELYLPDKNISRENLIDFEELLKNVDGAFAGDTENCPLKHSFSDGIYVREITIPAGMVIVGKIHKHDHPNFLLKGEVIVFTESKGEEHLKAPCSMISEGGTKRALYSITELVWTTVHCNPTNTRDMKELEKIVIADSFEEYEKFLLKEKSVKNRLKSFIIKKLST
jgi:hypothetical protein